MRYDIGDPVELKTWGLEGDGIWLAGKVVGLRPLFIHNYTGAMPWAAYKVHVDEIWCFYPECPHPSKI